MKQHEPRTKIVLWQGPWKDRNKIATMQEQCFSTPPLAWPIPGHFFCFFGAIYLADFRAARVVVERLVLVVHVKGRQQ